MGGPAVVVDVVAVRLGVDRQDRRTEPREDLRPDLVGCTVRAVEDDREAVERGSAIV
jgi:DNA gyrase inhibitor GyrI